MHDDSTLLQNARRGDRDAFGALVVRYEGLISGLTFHATRDLVVSEDLAQQTFLTAWSRLGELREPDRFRGWLAGIARNLVRHYRRANDIRPADATEPSAMQEMLTSHEPSPLDRASRKERAQQVWSTLSQVPEPYRETMVLYYRGEQSIADVAAATGVSLDAAKQRLARGRSMLREGLARNIEDSLSESRPYRSFSASVLALLPASTAAKAGGLGAVLAKLPMVGPWLVGPLIGVAGAVLGSWCSLRAARNEAERRATWRSIYESTALVVIHLAALLAIHFWIEDPTSRLVLTLSTWGVWAVALVILIVTGNRRLQVIREQETGETEPTPPPSQGVPANHTVSTRALRYNMLGTICGSSLWLVLAAARSGDLLGVSVVLAAIGGLLVQRWMVAPRAKRATQQIAYNADGVLLATGIVGAAVLWRWSLWMQVPLPGANLTTLPLFALVILLGGGIGGLIRWKAFRYAQREKLTER